MYWMHLEVSAGITLAMLDRFLRDTWLECCGHLSAFEIGGVRSTVDAGMYEWDTGGKSMQVRLDTVLSPGQTCSYEYDFGSTTELTIKVLSEQKVDVKGRAIQILARNNLPLVPCDVCGEPASSVCMQCIYEDKGCLCDACVKDHECGEKRCCRHWSIHHGLVSVGIQVRTLPISGSQLF
jgi:Plasmid pRiA4b ORF-3-like protein